jgi:hypothetical protein
MNAVKRLHRPVPMDGGRTLGTGGAGPLSRAYLCGAPDQEWVSSPCG